MAFELRKYRLYGVVQLDNQYWPRSGQYTRCTNKRGDFAALDVHLDYVRRSERTQRHQSVKGSNLHR